MARAPFAPMLAVTGPLPTGTGWLYEFKWDGMRLIVDWDTRALRLWSRNGNEATDSYPELAALADRLGPDRVVLDGEVVVLDERSRPDFGLLQRRMHVRGAEARRLVATHPVQLFCFDLLRAGGRDLLDLPLLQRRSALEALDLQGPSWRVPPAFADDGPVVLDTASALGLEGVIAKRISSPYEPGRRSPNWRKVKLFQSDEFVVGGFTTGTGRRGGSLGALLLGAFDADGSFCFVGNVGSGFSDAQLDGLRALLDPYVTGVDPFEAGPARPAATFVEPGLVVEVSYSGWTRDGVLRHPSFRGIRTDRPAAEVTVPPGASGRSGP